MNKKNANKLKMFDAVTVYNENSEEVVGVVTGGPVKMVSVRGGINSIDGTLCVFEVICTDGKMRYVSHLDISNTKPSKSSTELMNEFNSKVGSRMTLGEQS